MLVLNRRAAVRKRSTKRSTNCFLIIYPAAQEIDMRGLLALIAGVLGALVGSIAWVLVANLPMPQPFHLFLAVIVGPVLFLGSIIWAVCWAERAYDKSEEQSREQARERAEAIRQHENTERSLSYLREMAPRYAGRLSPLLRSSEDALHVACQEFEEGLYAPFWAAIEKAASDLANFERILQDLISGSEEYKGLVGKSRGPQPPYQLGIQTLPDACFTADKLRALVRRAQKDFQFATIYEQRKTNQLLIEGFSTLGEAIFELGDRLEDSLEAVASTVAIAVGELASEQREATSRLEDALDRMTERDVADSDARGEHEHKVEEMLDNIQRRKRPWRENLRDGQY